MTRKDTELFKRKISTLKKFHPDLPIDEFSAMRLIISISKNLETKREKQMQKHGLHGLSWLVLVMTYSSEEQKMIPTQICTTLNQAKATMTRIIDELIDRGYLMREHDLVDRRKVFISITEKGKEFVSSELMSTHIKQINNLWQGCDVKLLIEQLDRALSNLEENND
jgi:DNA-binding MarR family transcriptional regulator